MSPDIPRRAVTEFRKQRSSAAARGIGWELTLTEWWKIWHDSGYYHLRGPDGYMMCRKLDVGPYAVGNVEIQTGQDNQRTRWKMREARRVRYPWRFRQKPRIEDVLETLIEEEDNSERAA